MILTLYNNANRKKKSFIGVAYDKQVFVVAWQQFNESPFDWMRGVPTVEKVLHFQYIEIGQ